MAAKNGAKPAILGNIKKSNGRFGQTDRIKRHSLSSAFGVGKSVKAAIDVKKANKTNRDANDLIENANEKLGFAQKIVKQDLENLGKKKAEILDEEINRFILSFEKLTNVEIDNLNGLDDNMNYKVDKVSLDEMKKLGGLGTSILSGVAGGTLGGALTAFGAAVAAQTFAKASTGVLISTLSGAAAKNATLAFLEVDPSRLVEVVLLLGLSY